MSAVLAVAPLRRRTLERKGMTPEEELKLLVQEQKADDTYFIRKPVGEVSLESPAPGQSDSASGCINDFIGMSLDGEVVSFLPREESLFARKSSVWLAPPKHGIGGYNNHGCRCGVCRGALAEYRRRRRNGE